jgi:hypothetical protein
MVRQVSDLMELAQGALVILILALFAWAFWTALTDAYSPVMRLLHGS